MSNSFQIEDIVRLVREIEHHKGKHLKSTLALLENRGTLDKESRKIILDGFNNFNRQVLRLIGYNVET